MGIPSIQPYEMPRSGDLPSNQLSWRPDPRRAALLIHDMQDYFIGHYDIQTSPAVELLANLRLVRERCAASGIPIVYTKQPAEQTPEQRGLLRDLWGPGLARHPHKEAIVKELTPGGADTVLSKLRYSAFQRTALLEHLRRWRRDQIIICGVYAHIGCMITACEAFMNDVQPFFVIDATADFSLDLHKMAITYVAQRCGVALPTRDLVAALDRPSTAAITTCDASAPSPLEGPAHGALSLERLRREVSDLLEQPASEIPDHEDLLELGLDSIRLMALVERWRSGGIEVTFVELAEHRTLVDWLNLLSSRAPGVLLAASHQHSAGSSDHA